MRDTTQRCYEVGKKTQINLLIDFKTPVIPLPSLRIHQGNTTTGAYPAVERRHQTYMNTKIGDADGEIS
ncbi:hypothetical protein VTK26DRAFT_8807 [Humicola hyalothermophila]